MPGYKGLIASDIAATLIVSTANISGTRRVIAVIIADY
jgi:hypothetical protein